MIQKIRMRGSGISAVTTFGELQPGAVLDDLLSILGDDDLARLAIAISANIADIVVPDVISPVTVPDVVADKATALARLIVPLSTVRFWSVILI